MSKRSKRLRGVFEVEVSESLMDKIKGGLGGAKEKAVEKVPAKKPKGRAARQIQVREQGERCTGRNPRRDRTGKCTRGKKIAMGKR